MYVFVIIIVQSLVGLLLEMVNKLTHVHNYMSLSYLICVCWIFTFSETDNLWYMKIRILFFWEEDLFSDEKKSTKKHVKLENDVNFQNAVNVVRLKLAGTFKVSNS